MCAGGVSGGVPDEFPLRGESDPSGVLPGEPCPRVEFAWLSTECSSLSEELNEEIGGERVKSEVNRGGGERYWLCPPETSCISSNGETGDDRLSVSVRAVGISSFSGGTGFLTGGVGDLRWPSDRSGEETNGSEVEVKEGRGKSSEGIGGSGELSLAVPGSLVSGVEGIAIDKGFAPFIEIECRDETNARSPTARIQSG